MKKIFIALTCWRFVFHWIFYKTSKMHDVIADDLARNISQFILGKGASNYSHSYVTFYRFCYLLTFYKMVRNIFYARVSRNHKMLARVMKVFALPQPLLDISSTADIGGGLIIQHGYSTIVDPKKIGKDCWINQNVTIGYTNETDAPILGNNVTIYAGAIVVGEVKIGDNVIIAANAAVVKDVEDNCVVGGVPAKILKRKV